MEHPKGMKKWSNQFSIDKNLQKCLDQERSADGSVDDVEEGGVGADPTASGEQTEEWEEHNQL